MIIFFSILTIGLFLNNIKVQETIYDETPLQKEIKQILKKVTGKHNYGNHKVIKSMDTHQLFFLIKNYIFHKNLIINSHSIVIYSHSYTIKNRLYNDKITFILKKDQLEKIIYKRVPALKIPRGPGVIKIPSVKKKF